MMSVPERFSQAVLTLAVANITAFHTHKGWLAETLLHVDGICMMETNLKSYQHRGASAWFKSHGWESSWGHSPGIGFAGGVGIASSHRWPLLSSSPGQRWIHCCITGLAGPLHIFVYYGSAADGATRDRDGARSSPSSSSCWPLHHCW